MPGASGEVGWVEAVVTAVPAQPARSSKAAPAQCEAAKPHLNERDVRMIILPLIAATGYRLSWIANHDYRH
jgi:hypothetical protein